MICIVVLDMAGTTVNEDNVVYKTLQRSVSKKGFDISLDQVLAEGAGREKLQALKSILKKFAHINDDKLAEDIYQDFIIELDKAYHQLHVLPQPHAVELFQHLKKRNIRVVLNTGYNGETARLLTDKLLWKEGREFDILITASDVKNSRPDPDMIWLAMEKLGVRNARDVAKVGDSIIDIEEGQNAGCGLSIGITTGAHTMEQLLTANPDYIMHDLLELLPILDKIKN